MMKKTKLSEAHILAAVVYHEQANVAIIARGSLIDKRASGA